MTRISHYLFLAVFCTLRSFVLSQIPFKYGPEISYANFLKLPGFFLEASKIVRASSTLNSVECGLSCLYQNGCVSFNFKHSVSSGGTNCELLAVDRFFNSTVLRQDIKYNHFYIKRTCDESPCMNGGTCRSNDKNENYTCECTGRFKGFTCGEPICSREVAHGMEDGTIKSNQLSMSSYYNNDGKYGQNNGRLNKKTWPQGAQVNVNDKSPWFQIDLLAAKVITAVGIQGYGSINGASWTTSYQISSSVDGTTWQWYQERPGINKTITGNTDAHAEERAQLDPPIIARLVKIWAATCKGYCTFRLELYGCDP